MTTTPASNPAPPPRNKGGRPRNPVKVPPGRKLVQIDYAPRRAFVGFHERKQRFACVVCHRRAGKTVAAVNDVIKSGITCKNGLFAYIAPYRSQAKAVAWDMLKEYAKPVMKSSNETDLSVDLINGSRIRLYGADSADNMRGLGFDGVFMDEYGDFRPSVWGNVIRPTLSDKLGWAVFAGTPKGKNQFWDVYDHACSNPGDWFSMKLPASTSKLLQDSELTAAKQQLSEDQYLQEYECSFEAAIVGAIYGVEMRDARIGEVAYDDALPVHTAWDLGWRDDTAIWWYQVVRGEVHVLEHYAVSGATIEDLCRVVTGKPYKYGKHHLPHDARAKTLAAQGKAIIEQMVEFLGFGALAIVPDIGVQDGIQAVRRMMPRVWFDKQGCGDGIEALRQYQREYDEDKKAFRSNPLHNWCSHPADAFRVMAVAWRREPGVASNPEAAKVLLVGPENMVTLNDMWEDHASRKGRVLRI